MFGVSITINRCPKVTGAFLFAQVTCPTLFFQDRLLLVLQLRAYPFYYFTSCFINCFEKTPLRSFLPKNLRSHCYTNKPSSPERKLYTEVPKLRSSRHGLVEWGLNKFYPAPMSKLLTFDFSTNVTNIQEMRAQNSNSVTVHYKVVTLLSHQLLASSSEI